MSDTTAALQQGQDAVNGNIDRTMSGLKDGVANATAGLEQAQGKMKDGMAKAMTTAQDAIAFGQGNFEAVARASQILATGLQDMGQTAAAAAKASMDDTMGTVRAMAGAKSIKEAMELQANLLRSMMEKAVAQTGRFAETSMKLSEQTFAPIGARVALATETFGRLA